MNCDQLKLDNQICFPFYAISRLITRAYKPFLDKLKLTYPQYLVMLVLWENDALSVSQLSDKLILNTNTLTPLLKRLEDYGFVIRRKTSTDERKIIISLSNQGRELKKQAVAVPMNVINNIDVDVESIKDMKKTLDLILSGLNK